MSKRSLVSRWARLGRRRKALLVEAVLALAVASAAIRFRSFKRAIRMGSLPLTGQQALDDMTGDVRWAVETAARNVPWRAMCIQQVGGRREKPTSSSSVSGYHPRVNPLQFPAPFR